MSVFEIFAVLFTLAALFSYLNLRFLHAPRMIALLLGGVLSAVVIAGADQLFPGSLSDSQFKTFLGSFNFSDFVLHGVLGFIIFAGALEVDMSVLRERKATVVVLASAGVVISTLLVGAGTFFVLRWTGAALSLAICLVFGAIISPTDPVAVLAIMRDLSVKKSLQVEASAESLFNDGIAIVLFSMLLSVATSPSTGVGVHAGNALMLLLREGVGGCVVGLVLGYAVYVLLKGINDPNIEVFLSFALVIAISAISVRLHFSGPLACAVAGLFIGHQARVNAMNQDTREALDTLWSFTDHALNTLLFLIVGLETLWLGIPSGMRTIAIVATIVLVILARFISVWIASQLVPRRLFSFQSVIALTWGGLRGAVSIALALSVPDLVDREFLLQATYATVLFSVIVQGLTVQPLLRRLSLSEQAGPGENRLTEPAAAMTQGH